MNLTKVLILLRKKRHTYKFHCQFSQRRDRLVLCITNHCFASHSPVEKEMQDTENEAEAEKEQSGKREKPVVRPEEIPPVPENRFLLRRDMPSQENKTDMSVLSILICLFLWTVFHLTHCQCVYLYDYKRCLLLKFLLFRVEKEETFLSTEQKPAVSKSGRKIRGRGTMVCLPQLRSDTCQIWCLLIHFDSMELVVK